MKTFCNFISTKLKNFVLKIGTLILAAIILFTIPLIFILSIPLFTIRFIVSKSSRFIRPDLGKMVTTRGQVIATDDLFHKPKSNVICTVVAQGNVDLALASQNTRDNLLAARLQNGDLKFPELTQHITTWAGYYFWKDDKKFDIRNHVKVYDKRPSSGTDRFTDDDVEEIRQVAATEKWEKKRPLWTLTLIPNCYPEGAEDLGPHTTLLLKFHHTLGDGYSWLFLLVQDLCGQVIQVPEPNYPERNQFVMFFYLVTLPIRGALDIASELLLGFTSVPFKVPLGMQKTGNVHTNVVKKIPLSAIKGIKSHFKVSFSAVLFAVLAGAVRELMIKKKMEIPKILPTLTVLPLPEHSVKLRNYMTAAVIHLPIGKLDPLRRLKFCQKDIERIRRSTIPLAIKHFFVIGGSYFTFLTKLMASNFVLGTGISNFPVADEPISYCGYKCVDVMFFAGLQTGCLGLGFFAMSYANGYRISLIADGAVITKDELKDLSDLIEKQVHILQQHIAV